MHPSGKAFLAVLIWLGLQALPSVATCASSTPGQDNGGSAGFGSRAQSGGSGIPIALAADSKESDASKASLRTKLALEGGYYHISFRGFSDQAASIAPIINLSTDRIAATIKYLYTRYTLGTSDVDKHDIDSSITFFLHRQIGLFVGFRAEIQQVRVADESGGDRSFSFNVYALPLGATASARIPRTNLYLFGVGTVFAYTRVNQRSPRSDEEGFGGYALAGGLAWPLDRLLETPLSLKLAYRFQNLEVGDFDEEVDQVNLGMTWQF